MALLVALKQGPHGLLLVITDKNLLGRRIEEGNLQLDLRSQFYQGEEKSKTEIARNMLSMGMDLKVISSATGLSRQEIKGLYS